MSFSQRISSHSTLEQRIPEGRPRRFSTIPAGRWELTVQLFKKILIAAFVFTGTLLGNLLTLGIPTLISRCSEMKKANVKQGIETLRVARLQSALKCGLSGNEKWRLKAAEVPLLQTLPNPTKEETYFFSKVAQLREAVAKLKPTQPDAVETLYKQFQRLAKDPTFIKVFRDLEPTDHPAVNFLKLIAAKFRSADVSNLLIQHAKEELGSVKPDQGAGFSIGKTGEALVEYRKKPSFKHNFLWAISHPFAWFHSCEGEWLHKKYDSHLSNPTYTVHQFDYTTQDRKKIRARFMAGPTPFNDPVYHKIFLKEGHELRYNIMDTAKAPEHAWIKKMDNASKESDGHLEHIVWGFATKEKQGYLEASELDPLIDKYEKALLNGCRTLDCPKRDNGVLIPQKFLSDPQIKEACRLTKSLLSHLDIDLTHKSGRHAALVAVDTMMAMGIMINYLESLKHVVEDETIDEDMRAIYIATACKQCFDRGPVYFSALMLFFRSLNNSSPLTEEEFYKIAGFPLFRAPLNEGREQIHGKFTVYEQFAKMFGTRMDTLSNYTKTYRAFLQTQ